MAVIPAKAGNQGIDFIVFFNIWMSGAGLTAPAFAGMTIIFFVQSSPFFIFYLLVNRKTYHNRFTIFITYITYITNILTANTVSTIYKLKDTRAETLLFCNYSAPFPFNSRHPRTGGDPGGDWAATRVCLSHTKRLMYRWIPAYAGMTKNVLNSYIILNHRNHRSLKNPLNHPPIISGKLNSELCSAKHAEHLACAKSVTTKKVQN